MGGDISKILNPLSLFGMIMGGDDKKETPAPAAEVTKPAPGAGAKREVEEMEARHRGAVQQRARGASVALADEDREVLGAGRRLGRQGRTGGGVGRQKLGSLG